MPKSALRKTGSTRQWRRLRIPLLLQLARDGYLPCAARRSTRCLGKITRPQDLRAGHVIPRALGGNDRHLQPECPPCSNEEGGTIAHQLQHQTAPARPW